nr:MAG TPA: hypothetical protein [Caudoviricetes sp.]
MISLLNCMLINLLKTTTFVSTINKRTLYR